MDFTGSDIFYVFEGNITDSSFLQSQSQSELSQETVESDICNERKFLVCEGMLNLLFQFCLKCGSLLSEFSKFVNGSMLGIPYICNNKCSDTWRCQPLLRGMPAGNLLMCATVLHSGAQYSKFADIADMLHMPIPSSLIYFRIQEAYLFPVVKSVYNNRQEAMLSASADETNFLCGDG